MPEQPSPQWFRTALMRPRVPMRVMVGDKSVCYQLWDNAQKPDAPGILLLHGSGAHSHWWDFIAGLVDDRFRIAAMDLPGMGDSDFRDEYSRGMFAESAMAVCEHAGLSDGRSLYLVGHSFGGAVAIHATQVLRPKMRGLILVDTPIRPPDYDYDRHRGSGPIRPSRPYPRREDIIGRFRLVPPQPPVARYIHDYISRYSVRFCGIKEGWRWKYDDRMFTSSVNALRERHRDLETDLHCHLCLMYGTESTLMTEEVLQYMTYAMEGIVQKHARQFVAMPLEGLHHHLILQEPEYFAGLLKTQIEDWES